MQYTKEGLKRFGSVDVAMIFFSIQIGMNLVNIEARNSGLSNITVKFAMTRLKALGAISYDNAKKIWIEVL